MSERCAAGEWAEIERTLLPAGERAESVPPETGETPLLMWVRGFATSEAAVGDDVEIETMSGRVVAGRLTAVNPGYLHTFGEPIPELAQVGRELRARLAEFREGA